MKIEELPDGFINYEGSILEPIIKVNNTIYYSDGSYTSSFYYIDNLNWHSINNAIKATKAQLNHTEVRKFFNEENSMTPVEAAKKYLDGYTVVCNNSYFEQNFEWSSKDTYRVLDLIPFVGRPMLYENEPVIIISIANNRYGIITQYAYDNNKDTTLVWVSESDLKPVPRECEKTKQFIQEQSNIIPVAKLEDGQTAVIVKWGTIDQYIGTIVQKYKNSIVSIGKHSMFGWSTFPNSDEYLVKLVKLKVE